MHAMKFVRIEAEYFTAIEFWQSGRHTGAIAGRRLVIALAFGTWLCALSGGAHAQTFVNSWIDGAKLLADARLRFENVDDASKALTASALTLRARLGVQSGTWNGLSALVEMDGLLDINNQFNSTRNGKTTFPTVADPQMAVLNRLQLSYSSDFDTSAVLGRQRIVLGDQRFVGNAGWRQHEQTYDAFAITNTSIPGVTAMYAYIDRVNRVYGDAMQVPATAPAGAFRCDCHVLDVAYSGTKDLKVEAFGLLVDVSQTTGAVATKLATSRLSTATFGAQASYHLALDEDWTANLLASYAHQSDYGNNPGSVDLDYWRGEGAVSYANVTATVGYEAMQGNGTVGFSTPLATIHAFDGWADMFLTTPANGLDNFYVKTSYKMPFLASAFHIDSASATVIHRDSSTDRTDIGIGREWDGALEFGFDKALLLLQYADYQGSGVGFGGFADKSIGWVQLSYKY
jgi:hypothetical protein